MRSLPDIEFTLALGGVDYDFYVDNVYASAYVPAKTSGPPEECYEAEGGEFEFTVHFAGYTDEYGNEVILNQEQIDALDTEYSEEISDKVYAEIFENE